MKDEYKYECEICNKKFVSMKEAKEHDKTHDLNKDVKTTGIILIILGVLHFILSGFLDASWALVLIPVGIVCLFYRSRIMLLMLGILLIIVGILNFVATVESSMVSGNSNTFWSILGFFQIYWGIKEIGIFRRTKENPKYRVTETRQKGFIWYSLRISFWVLVGFWVLERGIILFGLDSLIIGNLTFSILEWFVLLFVLLTSIIHLVRYKKKDFAIVSLIVSIILILLTGYSLIYTANLQMTDLFTEIQMSNMDDYCSSTCENVNYATAYLYYYDYSIKGVNCECINDNNETLQSFVIPDNIVSSQIRNIRVVSKV